MRDFKTRLLIIWCLLRNRYTSGGNPEVWWLWTDEDIEVVFDKDKKKG